MILISSCLADVACRYNGEAATIPEALDLYERGLAVIACPEVLGGLGIPRTPSEIVAAKDRRQVVTIMGDDVTQAFETGAAKTLELCKKNNIRYAVMKDRSPSCGSGHIYDGRFSGTVIEGDGVTAALLKKNGIKIHVSSKADFRKLIVYDFLEREGIPYEKFNHVPCHTVEDVKALDMVMPGQHCKNLFLRNQKGNRHYLVILQQDRPFDTKQFAKDMEYTRLSFGSPERLKKHLGVDPGSVGAFGLLYDTKRQLEVVVDRTFNQDGDITFHPNRNDETLKIRYNDFESMLKKLGYTISYW